MLVETDDLVTCGHAATAAGVSRFWMRQLLQSGRVAGVEIDGQWFARRGAAEAFTRHPTAGRPVTAKRATKRPAKRASKRSAGRKR